MDWKKELDKKFEVGQRVRVVRVITGSESDISPYHIGDTFTLLYQESPDTVNSVLEECWSCEVTQETIENHGLDGGETQSFYEKELELI